MNITVAQKKLAVYLEGIINPTNEFFMQNRNLLSFGLLELSL